MLILALLASCSKDYIEEEIVFNSTPIKQEVQEIVVTPTQVQSPVLFQSKAPSYSGVNNTVGSLKKNYFYPGFNHIETLEGFRSNMKNSTFLDFDRDGQLDLFSILFSQGEGYAYAGSCSSKIKIVKNIFTDNKEEFIYDSPYNWGVSDVHLNDFNGDGSLEVVVGSNNSHQCGSYNGIINGNEIPISIFYINSDGTYVVDYITPPTSVHDLASGDLDNDGDIDIFYFTLNDTQSQEKERPYILLNDGNGNFNISDSFLNLYPNMYNQSFGLLDLNNDNILDLAVAGDEWSQRGNNTAGFRVYWGLGSATFDTNVYSELTNEWLEYADFDFNRIFYQGISFTDYNNDSYYDIIINGSPDYKGEFLFILTNNGDQTFTDLTIDTFDEFYTYSGQQGGPNELGFGNPTFRTVVVYDKDNDGDFDLVPSESEWDYLSGPWNGSFYYENNTGSFVRVYE